MIKSIENYVAHMKEVAMLEIIGEAYNTLNSTLIESVLDDDVVYNSFWVYASINGKNDLMYYLQTKFTTILCSEDLSATRIFAEMGYLRDDDRPILILTQGTENRLKIDAILMITVEENFVKTIDLTSAHLFSKIRCTGTYPAWKISYKL